MPRRRLRRRIGFMPRITRFTPIAPFGAPLLEEITLTLDELEALRLKDLEGLDQEKAAEQMGISQPTFHRMLLDARKKVADALVNNKQIKIQGGTYKMIAAQPQPKGAGAGFGRAKGAGAGRLRRAGGPPTVCVCPACGNQQPKVPGLPCAQMRCQKCGALMVRG